MASVAVRPLRGAAVWVAKQEHDWKVIVVRLAGSTFFQRLVQPYDSIFVVALGASAVQLGVLHSVGLVSAAVLALLTGWAVDKYGVKRIFVAGLIVSAFSPLLFSFAVTWALLVPAMVLRYVGQRSTLTCCGVVCAGCLQNQDRATGMMACSVLRSLLVFLAPLLGAFLVVRFGGLSVGGIRPLYYIAFGGAVLLVIFLGTNLRGYQKRLIARAPFGFIKGMGEVFRQGTALRRWLVVSAITWLPNTVLIVYTALYAHQVKGASEFVLAWMTTASVLVPLFVALPLGRMADRIGRKKVMYLATPMGYISCLLLILSPNTATLVAAGALQGFYMVNVVISNAVSAELVPMEHMGTWQGLLSLFQGLLAAVVPTVGGLIWSNIGPQYVFIALMALDLLVKVPFLLAMPETLRKGRPMRVEF